MGSVDVRSAPGKPGALAPWQGRGGLEARAGVVSKRERTRKEMSDMSQGMSRTAAQIDVAFPGGSLARAQPLVADRTTRRRGERTASSNIGSCPRVRIGLQISASNISCLARAQAKRGASEGWTTRAASQDSRGELLRTKRGAIPKEGVSDRVKSPLSRGAMEAVSVPRATTQTDLQRRRRDPRGDEASEAKS